MSIWQRGWKRLVGLWAGVTLIILGLPGVLAAGWVSVPLAVLASAVIVLIPGFLLFSSIAKRESSTAETTRSPEHPLPPGTSFPPPLAASRTGATWWHLPLIFLAIVLVGTRLYLVARQALEQAQARIPVTRPVFDPPLVDDGSGTPRGSRLRRPGVYVAPFADFPVELLVELQQHYRTTWGIDLQILEPITIEGSALPTGESQLDAFNLTDQVQRAYVFRPRSEGVLIGYLTFDVRAYATGDFWNFGAVNPGGYATISTARMDPRSYGAAADDRLLMERLRKMTTRYIALTVYGLPRSTDPESVLYEAIRSSQDLDRMTEWPCPGRPAEMVTC